jgi:hypothetical protein
MDKPTEKPKNENKVPVPNKKKILNSGQLGSSNAFEETENPLSRDQDNISDEKLDELLGDD